MAVQPKTRRDAPKTTEEQFQLEFGDGLLDNIESKLNEDGSISIEFLEEEEEELDIVNYYNADEHYKNLVEDIDDEVLDELGTHILDVVANDEADRQEWLKTIEFGLDLLGVKVQEKHEPFEGACSAQHPLLMESAVKFQSKASNELLPADGPVRCKVLGDVTEEKELRAQRVAKHMNYQITEKMTEFYTDTERLLLYVPIVGSGFKKTYYDSNLERPVSEFIPADQVIVPNSASDLYRAPHFTHILYKTKYEFDADCADGLYEKPDDEVGIGDPSSPKLTEIQKKTNSLMGVEIGVSENSDVYTLYECYIDTYIEGIDAYEGKEDYELASPYIVTVEANTGRVVGLRRNWAKGDVKRKKKVPLTHYQFVPGFGFYSFGFLHLLGNLQLSLTSSLRSLVDAGQFANLQGGFKLKGTRIKDDGMPISPGQFKDLESVTQDIHKAIMPLPFKEPSQVLYMMLEFLDKKGQKFADATEQVVGDSSNYGPVGTTMALLDASTKFFSAIHKRLHASLKNELKALAQVNAETLPKNLEYNLENETVQISRADYDATVDIVPVSDPNISSNAHRMAKAQTLYQIAQTSPDQHDMREVLKHVYINMGYENYEKFLPKPEEAVQQEPVQDVMSAQQGKPIKAFPGQDHKAHIALKQAFLQDPLSGANPMMQKAAIAIQANIQEHMLLGFVEQAQAQAENSGAPIEQAAQQLAQMNQKQIEMEQQQANKDGQDQAALLLAQAEMLDSQNEVRKQEWKEKYDIARLELDKEKLDADMVKEARRLDQGDLKHMQDIQKIVTTKGLDSMIQSLSQPASQPVKVDKPKKVDKE